MKHWVADLPEGCETLMIGGCVFTVVGLATLRELYRRGLESTVCQGDEGHRAKHTAIAEKHKALGSLTLCSLSCQG